MTNTATTDVEVLERNFPVLLREFSIRRGSGGAGLHRGGALAVVFVLFFFRVADVWCQATGLCARLSSAATV